MTILSAVRQRVPGITLTIVGTSDRHTRRYLRSLRALAQSLGPWIDIREDLSRDELRELMSAHRYGIHGMREEHFGMAPAELVRAGVIVWCRAGRPRWRLSGNDRAVFDGDDGRRREDRRHIDERSSSGGCAFLSTGDHRRAVSRPRASSAAARDRPLPSTDSASCELPKFWSASSPGRCRSRRCGHRADR